MEITRPAITRLSRKAGIKSVSEECFAVIRNLISQRVEQVLNSALIVNAERQTKTLMVEDIRQALALQGENITESTELGTKALSL